ncbi:MAG: serine protease [Polyangiaceae bacterium]|nr:serine protease [Polyangiaceae bacterium]
MNDRVSDLAASVRSSVVSILSPTSRGSGYCALPNGLIVTSLDVVGYEREVQVTFEDGITLAAFVVRANVALDVALVMPVERAPLFPLDAGGEARVGDSVLAVGRIGNEPIVVPASIVSTGRVCEGFAHLQLDVACEEALRGAPLVNKQGGVLGFVTRPRAHRVLGDRRAHRMLSNLVLPSSAFEGGLMSADGPAEQMLELVPEYGCPSCDTIFEPEMDRCFECGVLLPHRWTRDANEPPTAVPPLKGQFAVKAALASLGIPSNRARVGPSTWRFSPSFDGQDAHAQVDVTTDPAAEHLVLRAPVVRLPMEGFEHVYRYLLTLNDAGSGGYRFGAVDRTVYLSLFEPVSSVDASTFPTTVSEFSRTVGRHRAALQRHFGLEAAYEHETD